MDAQWLQLSGMYCSVECARWENRFVIRGTRTPQGWEARDVWMEKKYQGDNFAVTKR